MKGVNKMSRLDAIAKVMKESKSGRGDWFLDSEKLEKEWGVKQWVPEEGDNFIAILPPADENKYFGTRVFVHYSIGTSRSAFLCPRETTNAPCPICEERDRLKQQNASKEELSLYKCFPPRFLLLIVDTQSPKTIAEGVKYFDCPSTVNDSILSLSKSPRTGEFIDITAEETLHDFVFVREGKGRMTKYVGARLDEPSDLPDEVLAKIEGMPDLDSFLIQKDYETIKEQLDGSMMVEKKQEAKPDDLVMEPTKDDGKGVSDIADRIRRRVANLEEDKKTEEPKEESKEEQEEATPLTRARRRRR